MTINDWLFCCAQVMNKTELSEILKGKVNKPTQLRLLDQHKRIKERIKDIKKSNDCVTKWDTKISFIDFCEMQSDELSCGIGKECPEALLQKNFFMDIIPRTDEYYGFFISQNGIGGTIMLDYEKYKKYFLAAPFYPDADVIYYCCTFKETQATDNNSNLIKCIRIDIDDFDDDAMNNFKSGCANHPFYELDERDLNAFVSSVLKLEGYPPPTYIVASGRGLHLYWALSKAIEKGSGEFKEYLKIFESINTFVGGDIALKRIAQGIRVPQSYNCKKNPPRKTKLVKGNGRIYLLSEMNVFTKLSN